MPLLSDSATASRQSRTICVLFAAIALIAVLITHGLMADDAMHEENAAECLATPTDTSPGKLCTPIAPSWMTKRLLPARSIAMELEDAVRPAPSGAHARHGPSDLQVFRT